jgi:hypothetical protein
MMKGEEVEKSTIPSPFDPTWLKMMMMMTQTAHPHHLSKNIQNLHYRISLKAASVKPSKGSTTTL